MFAWDLRWQQQPIILSGNGTDVQAHSLSESEVWEVQYDNYTHSSSMFNFSSSRILPAMICSEDGILAVIEQSMHSLLHLFLFWLVESMNPSRFLSAFTQPFPLLILKIKIPSDDSELILYCFKFYRWRTKGALGRTMRNQQLWHWQTEPLGQFKSSYIKLLHCLMYILLIRHIQFLTDKDVYFVPLQHVICSLEWESIAILTRS